MKKKSLIGAFIVCVVVSSSSLYASEGAKDIVPIAGKEVSVHLINMNVPITKAEFMTVILQGGTHGEQFPPSMDTHYALPVMKRAEELGIIDLKNHPMETWSEILSTEEKSAILAQAAANREIDMKKVYQALSEVLIEKVTVEGESIELGDKVPNHYRGKVMLPLRNIAEAMGFEVTWDAQTDTATLNNGSIESKVQVGFDSYCYKSVNAIGMSAPFSTGCAPKLIEGTVYVPSDYFSMFANWAVSDSTINFTSKNKE